MKKVRKENVKAEVQFMKYLKLLEQKLAERDKIIAKMEKIIEKLLKRT